MVRALNVEIPARNPPRAALLSVAGRVGPGHRINGDYELVEGLEPNGRPCWFRRGRPNITNAVATAAAGIVGLPEHDGEDRPLYLFFSEMGYWTIAPSVHATSIHVLARSGPDFSVKSPVLAALPWQLFAHGKARQDPAVVCFPHDGAALHPDAVSVMGCRDDHAQINGIYLLAQGVAIGSRPIFVKSGNAKSDRKLLYFSQSSGHWLVCSAALAAPADSVAGTEMRACPAWRDVLILARSPVAWTSLSPDKVPPGEPWHVVKELPPRLRTTARVTLVLPVGKIALDEESPSTGDFVPCPEMKAVPWSESNPQESCPQNESLFAKAVGTVGPRQVTEAFAIGLKVEQAPPLVCIYLRGQRAFSDLYGLNGDYAASERHFFNELPVYLKPPPLAMNNSAGLDSKEEEGQLFLFFDSLSRRWQVSLEVGSAKSCIARSAVCANTALPAFDSGPWQCLANATDATRAEVGVRATQGIAFCDCHELEVFAAAEPQLPRTVAFQCHPGGSTTKEAKAGDSLEGDFRLLQRRYGLRPVYRRSTIQPAGRGPLRPSLWLFFEPQSCHWLVSHRSPFAAPEAATGVLGQRLDDVGRFGKVLARSGPGWRALTPEESVDWQIAVQLERPVHRFSAQPQLLLASSLRLRALGTETPPTWVCMAGLGTRTQTLNGNYKLLPECQWASRPAWQRSLSAELPGPLALADGEKLFVAVDSFPKFMFFWPETGHWVIGPDLHQARTGLARIGPVWMAESPDRCPGRWSALDGHVFREDPKIFCRQLNVDGELPLFGLSCLTSPQQSLGPRASAVFVAARPFTAPTRRAAGAARIPAQSKRSARMTDMAPA